MSSKKPLVTTTYTMVKEGIIAMKKPHVSKESITHTIAANKIEIVNKTDKPQASKSKNDKSISNKSDKTRSLDKSMSLDKSRSNQGTETEDTVKTLNKRRSISSDIFYDKSANIE